MTEKPTIYSFIVDVPDTLYKEVVKMAKKKNITIEEFCYKYKIYWD